MLGASGIHKVLGRICRKSLLGFQHLLPTAPRKRAHRKRRRTRCPIYRLLSVGLHRARGAGNDDVGATPLVARLFSPVATPAQVCQGSCHSRPRASPESRVLFGGRVGRAGRVPGAIQAGERDLQSLLVWCGPKRASHLFVFRHEDLVHRQFRRSDLPDEDVPWHEPNHVRLERVPRSHQRIWMGNVGAFSASDVLQHQSAKDERQPASHVSFEFWIWTLQNWNSSNISKICSSTWNVLWSKHTRSEYYQSLNRRKLNQERNWMSIENQ